MEGSGFVTTVEVQEIVETGVDAIGIEGSADEEEWIYDPEGGVVKWFRDALQQVWIKFDSLDDDLVKKTLVIPADRVTFVEYPKT